MLQCKVCTKYFEQITSSHLKKHDLTMSEYRKLYPTAEIFSIETRKFLSQKCKKQNKESFGFKNGHKVNLGKKSWNKGLTKETDTRIKNLAELSKGRIRSEEHRKNLSISIKNSFKNGRDISGPKNGMHGRKLSEDHKLKLWRGWHNRMTRPEIKVNKILVQYGFKYTGDRKYWLKFKNGKYKNPDFILPKMNIAVEVFGRYWHAEDEVPLLLKEYENIDWKCFVVWEDEFFSPDILEQKLDIFEPEEFKFEDFDGRWML